LKTLLLLGQEIPWATQIQHHVYKISSQKPILSHRNAVHISSSCFSKIILTLLFQLALQKIIPYIQAFLPKYFCVSVLHGPLQLYQVPAYSIKHQQRFKAVSILGQHNHNMIT